MTDTGYNDTFSRPVKDLGGVPSVFVSFGEATAQAGLCCGKAGRSLWHPRPGKGPAGVRGKYGRQNRNQIQWAGFMCLVAVGPAYSCGFDNQEFSGRS